MKGVWNKYAPVSLGGTSDSELVRGATRDAVVESREDIALLEKKHSTQAKIIAQYQGNILRLGKNGNRKTAMDLLRKKKVLEKRNDVLGAQISTLQQASSGIEQMQVNTMVHDGMKRSNVVAKRVAKSMNKETVEDTMSDAVDMRDEHEDITHILTGGGHLGYTDVVDEDELAAELGDLMAAEEQKDPVHQLLVQPAPDKAAALRERAAQLLEEAQAQEMLNALPPTPNKGSGGNNNGGGGRVQQKGEEEEEDGDDAEFLRREYATMMGEMQLN